MAARLSIGTSNHPIYSSGQIATVCRVVLRWPLKLATLEWQKLSQIRSESSTSATSPSTKSTCPQVPACHANTYLHNAVYQDMANAEEIKHNVGDC